MISWQLYGQMEPGLVLGQSSLQLCVWRESGEKSEYIFPAEIQNQSPEKQSTISKQESLMLNK